MVKADSKSLELMASQIRRQLDQFLLKMNDVWKIQSRLNSCWDAEKCGSFSDVMNRIRGSVADIEDQCGTALKEIGEMIDIAKRYDSIRF